jgi:hypothetical protein
MWVMTTGTGQGQGKVVSSWGGVLSPVLMQAIVKGHHIMTVSVSLALIVKGSFGPSKCLPQPIEIAPWSKL